MINNKDYSENPWQQLQGPTAAGPGIKLHQSSAFVTLISEHTFKWRSLGVSEACNWLTASAGPHGKHWNHRLYAVAESMKGRWIRCCLFIWWWWEKQVWSRSEKKERKLIIKKLHCSVSHFWDYLRGHRCVWGCSKRAMTLNSSSLAFNAAFPPSPISAEMSVCLNPLHPLLFLLIPPYSPERSELYNEAPFLTMLYDVH